MIISYNTYRYFDFPQNFPQKTSLACWTSEKFNQQAQQQNLIAPRHRTQLSLHAG